MRIKSRLQKIRQRILHWIQRTYFAAFKKKRLPIIRLLDEMKDLNYVVLSADVPYMPADFPVSYPLGKDVDILVSKSDFAKAIELIECFRKGFDWGHEVEFMQTETHVRLKYLWRGALHYMIDCTCDISFPKLQQGLLSRRVSCGAYFVPEQVEELLYRASEYRRCPFKKHHLHYIQKHINEWNDTLASEYGIILPHEVGAIN